MKILVTSAHPDDIEPQMGGTILKYSKKGHKVLLLNAIIPCQDNQGNIIPKAKETRTKEAYASAKILGAKLKILNLDPYELKFDRKLIQQIDKVSNEFKPDIVYTCWDHDSHQDHVAMALATFASTRKNVGNLYMFEPVIPGGLVPYPFDANIYVDISKETKIKIKSIKAYKSQILLYKDWLPAILARARFRGFQINTEYAEAFQVIREIKIIR